MTEAGLWFCQDDANCSQLFKNYNQLDHKNASPIRESGGLDLPEAVPSRGATLPVEVI